MRRVAIVGLQEPSRARVPWDCETWLLRQDAEAAAADRVFEMHSDAWLREVLGEDYGEIMEEMADLPCLYTQTGHIGERYPLEAVAATVGGDYFASSLAYMAALAIHEGVAALSVYGCDMAHGTEYAYQRPNMEYLLGFARGRGIEVTVDSPTLLKSERYGDWQEAA